MNCSMCVCVCVCVCVASVVVECGREGEGGRHEYYTLHNNN